METAHHISACSQLLADERGFDGFTMEELAEAAGVSRRTLFNYFPGKADAVLGEPPRRPGRSSLEEFRNGGPHHDLVKDLGVLAHSVLSGQDRSTARRWRATVGCCRTTRSCWRPRTTGSRPSRRSSSPRSSSVRARPSTPSAPGSPIAVLMALFDTSLDAFVEDDQLTVSSPTSSWTNLSTAHELLVLTRTHPPTRPRTQETSMATLLYRLGKTAFRRWPLFLAGWLVVMVVVGTVAATMSKPMTDAFSIPGIPSEKAADLQAELFPGSIDAFDQANVNVVVAGPGGPHPRRARVHQGGRRPDRPRSVRLRRCRPTPQLTNPVEAAQQQRDADRRRRQGERRDRSSRPRPTPRRSRRCRRTAAPASSPSTTTSRHRWTSSRPARTP